MTTDWTDKEKRKIYPRDPSLLYPMSLRDYHVSSPRYREIEGISLARGYFRSNFYLRERSQRGRY